MECVVGRQSYPHNDRQVAVGFSEQMRTPGSLEASDAEREHRIDRLRPEDGSYVSAILQDMHAPLCGALWMGPQVVTE